MTIEWKGIELEVTGTFTKGEKPRLNCSNDDLCEGYPDEFEFKSIEIEGVEVYELIERADIWDELNDLACIEYKELWG